MAQACQNNRMFCYRKPLSSTSPLGPYPNLAAIANRKSNTIIPIMIVKISTIGEIDILDFCNGASGT